MTTNNDKALTVNVAAPSGAIIPRTIDEVARLARMAAASGLAKVSSPEAAGMLICAGLEIGLTPMQALLGMHMVEGRPTLAADTLVALVMRRVDVCEYWRSVERTAERHTIETKRRGEGHQPVRRTWTIDDAKRAGLLGRKPWREYPEDMLRHRCATALAREVYPDVVIGMGYTREEISDGAAADFDPQPVVIEQPRPAIDATPAPLALPRDNGPSPSGASLPAADMPDTTAPAAPPPAPSDLTPEHEAALEEFYARVAEVELPSEAVAVWMKHRAALSPIVARERENAWKALCSRVEEVGQMKNARVWLKKAIAEEDARRAAAEQRNPDDNDPTPGGGRRKAATKAADAAGDGADDRQTPVEGPAAWLASEDTTRAHVAAQRTEWEVQASARKHGRHLAAVAWGVRVYAERLQAMGVGTASQCERYVSAWAKAGPVVRAATAQRRAA